MGTRSSALARWQAEWVARQLTSLGQQVELVLLATSGDQRGGSLTQFGGIGVFTKEIQQALLEDRIDLAVHSLKDLPTQSVPGLTISAVPKRAAVADVLVSNSGDPLNELPRGARIGTGSPRRRAQLLHARVDLEVADIRGNVDTRLRKLDAGEYDAIVLARAGLERLGLEQRITEEFSSQVMLPAVGQGALGIETRAGDKQSSTIVRELNDEPSQQAVTAERRLLSALQAGCLAPIGAIAVVNAGQLVLNAVVISPDGKHRLVTRVAGPSDSADSIGEQAAEQLRDQGAEELISDARDD